MEKLYEKITFQNNRPPALNDVNLNKLSEALDAIDDRLIYLGGGLMKAMINANPELAVTNEALQNIASHPPKIGANGNWYIWNYTKAVYEDSKINAQVMTRSVYDADKDNCIDVTRGGTGNAYGIPQSGQKSGAVIGEYASAIGKNNLAGGAYSAAIGQDNITDSYGVAIGQSCEAGEHALAFGSEAHAEDEGVAFGSNHNKNMGVASEPDCAGGYGFKFAPDYLEPNIDYPDTATFELDGTFGAAHNLKGTQKADVALATQGLYVLFCMHYTKSTGAIYGATARFIAAHGLATGTPTNVSLGTTDTSKNPPPAIAMTANNHITITNKSATYVAQFSLIRIM